MKRRSPRAALARLARSTSAGSEAGGRSPGHSTPRSERGSASRPSTNNESGVPETIGAEPETVVTQPIYRPQTQVGATQRCPGQPRGTFRPTGEAEPSDARQPPVDLLVQLGGLHLCGGTTPHAPRWVSLAGA